jgi:hypothetical protein
MKFAIVLSICACTASSLVFAGEQQGTVKALNVRQSDGLIYVFLDGTPTGKPACATNSYWIIKNENSSIGAKQYAALIMAYALKKSVAIKGTSTCTRWPDGEDINEIGLIP